jgi:hypothetical protein
MDKPIGGFWKIGERVDGERERKERKKERRRENKRKNLLPNF